MTIRQLSRLPYRRRREGLSIKTLTGEKTQLCMIRLDPGMKTDHQHSYEPLGYILSGQIDLMIEEKHQTLQPGDAYHFPSNVQHGFHVTGSRPVEYIEIFTPPKPETE
ncbi:MAG: cupin domain-containing protein [Anaerolineales bacterium]|nr:cupin domain-containing protein [Anaerolineales bacterium]